MSEPGIFYMHTIDHQPAYYTGEYIAFASQYRGSVRPARLVRSLAEIRQQQRASAAWRAAQGYAVDDTRYGHIRVRLP